MKVLMCWMDGGQIKVFSVDIDGVIGVATEVNDWSYANLQGHKVNREVIDKVNELFDIGHVIILHTGRGECNREFTEKWLRINGVKFHELVMDKPKCDFYVDDRAIVGKEETLKCFLEF